MAAGPLSRVPLAAGSVADDLNYAALADIARLLHDQTTDYRVIGGLMVTALAARCNLGASLYRETLDADLGVPAIAARDLHIAGRLKAAGYQQVAGDRFERLVSDVPAGISGAEPAAYRAAIDVPVPHTPVGQGTTCEWAPTLSQPRSPDSSWRLHAFPSSWRWIYADSTASC
jgi:hypothetical protein